MQSVEHYPRPLEFNGFRFVDPQLLSGESSAIRKVMQPEPSNLTDVNNHHYHVWGTGRMSW